MARASLRRRRSEWQRIPGCRELAGRVERPVPRASKTERRRPRGQWTRTVPGTDGSGDLLQLRQTLNPQRLQRQELPDVDEENVRQALGEFNLRYFDEDARQRSRHRRLGEAHRILPEP